VDEIIKQMPTALAKGESSNQGCVVAVTEALKDKVFQVSSKSLILLATYLSNMNKVQGIKTDSTAYENIVALLLDKLAENRYRE
jgi:hypothetical protein